MLYHPEGVEEVLELHADNKAHGRVLVFHAQAFVHNDAIDGTHSKPVECLHVERIDARQNVEQYLAFAVCHCQIFLHESVDNIVETRQLVQAFAELQSVGVLLRALPLEVRIVNVGVSNRPADERVLYCVE
jgi:hypothetical protein